MKEQLHKSFHIQLAHLMYHHQASTLTKDINQIYFSGSFLRLRQVSHVDGHLIINSSRSIQFNFISLHHCLQNHFNAKVTFAKKDWSPIDSKVMLLDVLFATQSTIRLMSTLTVPMRPILGNSSEPHVLNDPPSNKKLYVRVTLTIQANTAALWLNPGTMQFGIAVAVRLLVGESGNKCM